MRDKPSFEQQVEWIKQSVALRYRRPAVARGIRHAVAEMLTRQRLVSPQMRRELREAWQTAAGELISRHSIPSRIARGVLEVVVADSMVAQEIALHRSEILKSMQRQLPDYRIRRLKCSVGVVGES